MKAIIVGLIALIVSAKAAEPGVQLPYGPALEAALPGVVLTQDGDGDLSWWHSLDRNNSINCTCGTFGKSNATERWEDEGIEQLNTYSWSVSLVSPGQPYAYCGGSLVNDRYVLTAASCVDGSAATGVEVLIGTWPYSHMNSSEVDALNVVPTMRRKVRRVIFHPKYASVGIDYNIALLRLQASVIGFGRGLSSVCLPKEGLDVEGLTSSSLVWRFAVDDTTIVPIKRTEVDSVLISQEECKSYKYNEQWENMPDTMMCSRTEKPSQGHPFNDTFACPGDAGGPLLVTLNGKKVQVGIDSWTPCFGRPDGIGVYTRISEFLPWINRHISKDGQNCAY